MNSDLPPLPPTPLGLIENPPRKHSSIAPASPAVIPEPPPEEAPPAPSRRPSFSRVLARQYGETAGVLLQYLAYHTSKSTNHRAGRQWVYKTLDDFVRVFPYLKRSTIHNTFQKLAKDNGPLMIGDYNKKGYDRTCWYAFRDDAVRKQAQSSEPVYFRADDAQKYGILAAVLLLNLTHWLRENRKTDPGYTAHAMSPRELAEILKFSRGAIQRALKSLVKAKVILAMPPIKKGGPTRYALVDETRLLVEQEEGGPNPDEVEGGGSVSDMGGPNPDMGGSVSDMPGPISDMGGSNLDNNTILIEYPLKDTPLEDPQLVEPSYVEPDLPTKPQNTSPDKLKGVIDVNPFARIVASGAHTQHQDQTAINQSSDPPSPEANPVSTSLPSAPASPPSVPIPPSLPPAPTSSSASPPDAPDRLKLSPALEASFRKNRAALDKDERAAKLADHVSGFLQYVIARTQPEQLAPFFRFRDQQFLHDSLTRFLQPHLDAALKTLMENKTGEEWRHIPELYSELARQFITQAFCIRFDDNYRLRSRWSYDVCVAIGSHMRAYWKAAEQEHQESLRAKQQETLRQRAQEHISPDQQKENRADLTPGEKVKVLRQSLHTRNSIGAFNAKNQLHHQVVEYNNRALDAAYVFFQANPDFTVAHLNAVLDRCLQLPKERDFREEGNDPLWHARRGRDIAFLIEHLDTIVASLNCIDTVPAFTPVPAEQLYRRRKMPEAE